MKQMLSKTDYINSIADKIRKANHTEDFVEERVTHIQCNNIDVVFNSRGYKYLAHFYLEKELKDLEFVDLGCYTFAMTIDNHDGTYDVTFSFLHICDLTDKFVYNDYKKHLVRNYYLNKYTVKAVKAATRINAICLAVNKESYRFPAWHRNARIQPCFAFYGNSKLFPEPSDCGLPVGYPSVLNKIGIKYSLAKKRMNDVYGVTQNDIRYYNQNPAMKIMAVKHGDSFSVTFSFVTPYDQYCLNKYCHNTGHRDLVDKVMLMTNYDNNKFTYIYSDGVSSMDTIVRAFNQHHFEFPNWARKVGMKIVFDWKHKNPKYDRV